MVQNGPTNLSVKKKIEGGQREGGHGVVHHLQQEYHQPYLMHHPTCQSKKNLVDFVDGQSINIIN